MGSQNAAPRGMDILRERFPISSGRLQGLLPAKWLRESDFAAAMHLQLRTLLNASAEHARLVFFADSWAESSHRRVRLTLAPIQSTQTSKSVLSAEMMGIASVPASSHAAMLPACL